MAKDTIVAAHEGLKFTSTKNLREPINWTVGPKCETNHGYWHCSTHDETFRNNFEKDGHVYHVDRLSPRAKQSRKRMGPCVLVWICYQHGAEVP